MAGEAAGRARTLVILGATGDLTQRLLLPGLGSLASASSERDAGLTDGLHILGSGRSERTDDEWRSLIQEAFATVGARGRRVRALLDRATYVAADPTDPEGLKSVLRDASDELILYFALPPAIVSRAVDALQTVGLPSGSVLVLEKPFGSDARSAASLNRRLRRLVPEERIYRVDHFLGMSTVLGVLGMRLANRLIEPTWNADAVERVEIVYDEDIGLEGRAGYYDRAGAMIDMIQSHLLQVLGIVAMEPPADLDSVDLRDAVAQALRATRVWDGVPVLPGTDRPSRRARYTAGTIAGTKYPAYAKEDGVDPARSTETLAEVAFEVDTARWAGVPFILRSGKALARPVKQIVLTYRQPRHIPSSMQGVKPPERIVIGLHEPTIQFDLALNGQDDPFSLSRHTIATRFADSPLTPYAEVLRGVLSGDETLAIRGDVAERCWRIVAPVLTAWKKDDVPLDEYRAGSTGPSGWRR